MSPLPQVLIALEQCPQTLNSRGWCALLLGCALVRSRLAFSSKLLRPAELVIIFNSFLHKIGDTITRGELS